MSQTQTLTPMHHWFFAVITTALWIAYAVLAVTSLLGAMFINSVALLVVAVFCGIGAYAMRAACQSEWSAIRAHERGMPCGHRFCAGNYKRAA